jgi:hypothetical protein
VLHYDHVQAVCDTHKHMEEGISDIFNIITKNGVPHQVVLNVMSDLYDGRHMWGFTEKDIKICTCWFPYFPQNATCKHI